MWGNMGSATNNSDGFNTAFPDDFMIARSLAKRAVDDWNAVIQNFNFSEDTDSDQTNNLNNTFNLTINAFDLMNGNRGQVQHPSFSFAANAKSKAATVEVDDNAAGGGWFFDSTPLDDAEFTAIVNSAPGSTGAAFQGSFVDINTIPVLSDITTSIAL
jgi:hypothetical protein